MDGLKESLIELTTSTITSFDTIVVETQGILTTEWGAAWSAAIGLSNALKPFCLIIIAICILIELAQVASKVDIIKWEHGLKVAVKLVLARVCIDIAPTFLRACYNQANIWIRDATSVGGSLTNVASTLATVIQDKIGSRNALLEIMVVYVGIWLLSVLVKGCSLLIQVIAYGRMFELYVLLAVSPLPCAFFPLGDGTGGGVSRITQKYFKSFIAVCLQGVMIILCLRIFNIIFGNTLTTMIGAAVGQEGGIAVMDILWSLLMGDIVLFMSVSRCGSWAKSIIDAM